MTPKGREKFLFAAMDDVGRYSITKDFYPGHLAVAKHRGVRPMRAKACKKKRGK